MLCISLFRSFVQTLLPSLTFLNYFDSLCWLLIELSRALPSQNEACLQQQKEAVRDEARRTLRRLDHRQKHLQEKKPKKLSFFFASFARRNDSAGQNLN